MQSTEQLTSELLVRFVPSLSHFLHSSAQLSLDFTLYFADFCCHHYHHHYLYYKIVRTQLIHKL